MDKNDVLDRTRLQQAGKAITDMIKNVRETWKKQEKKSIQI